MPESRFDSENTPNATLLDRNLKFVRRIRVRGPFPKAIIMATFPERAIFTHIDQMQGIRVDVEYRVFEIGEFDRHNKGMMNYGRKYIERKSKIQHEGGIDDDNS